MRTSTKVALGTVLPALALGIYATHAIGKRRKTDPLRSKLEKYGLVRDPSFYQQIQQLPDVATSMIRPYITSNARMDESDNSYSAIREQIIQKEPIWSYRTRYKHLRPKAPSASELFWQKYKLNPVEYQEAVEDEDIWYDT